MSGAVNNITQGNTEETEVKRYKRDAFVKNEKYKKYELVLETLLEEDESYTLKEVDSKLKKFLKGEVR